MATANSLLSVLDDCEFATPVCRNRSSQLKLRRAKCNGGAGMMMRRADRRRRGSPRNAVERKVRTLRKLIPDCESMGVERLFRETAEYIVALQRTVKVMQTAVDALSSGSDDE